MVTKFITEIRYIADPTFLDKRGQIVKYLLSKDFNDWTIQDNRIEISNKFGTVFVSFTNLGFITSHEDKLPEFRDRLDEALKFLGDLPPIRWGTRIIVLIPSKDNFPLTVKRYKDKLLNFDPNSLGKVGGELKDVGVSYIFTRDHNTYHITSGPMKDEQAKEIFKDKKFPKNSIFIDLDVYREKNQFYKDDFRRSRIKDFVEEVYTESKLIIDEFTKVLNEK